MGEAGAIVGRDSAALVVIDVQERLAAAMPRRVEVLGAIRLLMDASRLLGVPLVVTRQYPRGLGALVPEIGCAVEGAPVVDKTAFDCMREPGFRDALARTGRRQVVLCGMEAHICVTQTALSLAREGHDVHVVADAVCSRRDRDRDTALDRLRAARITVTTAESVIYEVLGEAGTDEFRAVLALVKDQSSAE
jgi:nicotinamidase-related amidase